MKNTFITFDDFIPTNSSDNNSSFNNVRMRVIGVGNTGFKVINLLYQMGFNADSFIAVGSELQNLYETKAGSWMLVGDNEFENNEKSIDRNGREKFRDCLKADFINLDILIVVSGLGGKIGLDTLPIIGEVAKALDILTIGIFTEPNSWENPYRIQIANNLLGVFEKQGHTSIKLPFDYVISKLDHRQKQESISFIVTQILSQSVKSIIDLCITPGLINLDVSDLKIVLKRSPYGFMAFGKAKGEDRAKISAERVVSNIIGDIVFNNINSAIINISGPNDLRLFEVNEVVSYIKEKLFNIEVNLVFGALIDDGLSSEIRVTLIGFGSRILFQKKLEYDKVNLLDDKNKEKKRELSVFLCHSSSDKQLVRKLYQKLYSQAGVDPWLDEMKLLPGENWDVEISKAVKQADVVIVCLSKDSINKEGYVQKEITRALDISEEKPEGTIFIVPLKLEECSVPSRLRSWQWLDYFQTDAYEKLILSLKKRAESLGIELI